MHGEAKITIVQLLVIVGLLVLLVLSLFTGIDGQGNEQTSRIVCMSNLRSVNSAIMLYKSANDGAYPWLYDKMTAWDTTPVGTNRNINPSGTKDDPNNPKPRSITALMFMLVRQDQPEGMFRCPSDKSSVVDRNVKADANDGDVRKGEYYLDFSGPENVSYSWQAPIWKDGRFLQGIDGAETDTVVVADMTPAATNPQWKPADVTQITDSAIEPQNSPNHKGKFNNILMVAGNVTQKKRPDVGMYNDNIFTASGAPYVGSRSATSLNILKHLSAGDTFLIGPVGRKAE